MVNDPIADLLTRIRNANQRKHKVVVIPYSKTKEQIVKILLEEGYIINFKLQIEEKKRKEIVIFLKYKGQQKVISGLRRISKPGLRIYSESTKIPKVLNGYGIAVISTSKGIMTDKKAKKLNLGGEVMAFVW